MGSSCCVGDFITNCGWNHPIQDFFEDLFSSDACCVGNSSGPSESEQHARKVANELAEMKEKIRESTSKNEREIMNYINQSMNSFMKEIDFLNNLSFGDEKLRINVDAIHKRNETLQKQVIGCISSVINKRLVQTDKELSVILGERDDKKRKKNFEMFVEKVKKQALDKLKKEIEKTVKAQSEVISSEIETRKKEVNIRLEESIKELSEIMEMKEQSNERLKRKQLEYMYQCTLCDLLLNEVVE